MLAVYNDNSSMKNTQLYNIAIAYKTEFWQTSTTKSSKHSTKVRKTADSNGQMCVYIEHWRGRSTLMTAGNTGDVTNMLSYVPSI